MNSRLILVEGFPGSGKSTTAQWLARQTRGAGHRAEWFYEEQRPHPLSRETPGAYSSWPEYLAERLRRWVALAGRAMSSDTVNILESAWLQAPLLLMLRQDLDQGLIRTFIRKIVEAMRRASPALIYLSQPAPEEGMRRLFDRRGMAWALSHAARSDASNFCRRRGLSGIDGLLRYWREHNALSEQIVRDSGMPALVLDPGAGDWHDRRAAITDFLGIRACIEEAPPGEADLRQLAGEYREGVTTFTIRLRGGGLVLDGLLWPGNRLLPVAPRVFEAESWPLVLTFLEVGAEIRSLRIDGPLVGGRRLAGVYERVG